MSNLHQISRRYGLGKLAYQLYFRPLSKLRDIRQAGGWAAHQRTRRGEAEMKRGCYRIRPAQRFSSTPPLEPFFLTGSHYWHQTFWCAYSLQQVSGRPVVPTLVDDGSLEEEHLSPFRANFPEVRLVSIKTTEENLDRVLPRKYFPGLRTWREKHPLLRKLTDVFLAREEGGILLDSDMLFFRKPEFLLDRFDRITRPCCMQDVHTAYGFSRGLLNALASGPIPEKANIGILGLPNHSLNPEELEKWLAHCIAREGRVYNLVQALCALHFSRAGVDVAPKSDYVVIDQSPRDWQPDAALYHFVAKAKPLYFQLAWKRALSLP